MAGEPIKFRCFQCQKLLGVSRSKAGAVVSCPKCGAGLLVPDLAPDTDPAASTAPPPFFDPSSESQTDATSSLVFGDLRLEPTAAIGSAGSVDLSAMNHSPAAFLTQPVVPDSEVAFPEIQTAETSLRPEPWRRYPPPPPLEREGELQSDAPPILAPTFSGARAANSPITVAAIPVLVPAPESIPDDAIPSPSASAVSEPIARVDQRLSTRRRDDVIVPRIVVILWSFFVVLALGFAFGAGLLWGYYLWVGRAATKS